MKNSKFVILSTLMGVFVFASCAKEVTIKNPAPASGSAQTAPSKKSGSAAADQTKDLPPKVKAFIAEHYAGIAIAKYEVKNFMGGKKYEVKLNNGVEIDFDNEGNWKEIKDPSGIPEVLVPEKIKTYVAKNYPGVKIESFNKKADGSKMKVDLLNDIELEFDMQGNFLRIDR